MRRRIVVVVLFLLLGAIVNVAVAWGCALRLAFPNESEFATIVENLGPDADDRWMIVRRIDGIGFAQHDVEMIARNVTDDEWSKSTIELSGGIHRWHWEGPVRTISWSRLGIRKHGDRSTGIEAETAAGWPMISLWCADSEYDSQRRQYKDHPRGKLILKEYFFSGTGLFGSADYVPYLPVWSGLIFNTMYYAAWLWAVICGPFVIRRWRRVRKGLCSECAYPVGESNVCTECGRDVSRHVR